MKTLLIVTAFAALTVYPAAACDWNREASTQRPVVASTDQTPQVAPACSGNDCGAPQLATGASERTTHKTVDEAPPVVLVTDRR